MTLEAATERINLLTSHAWMVRQFLKHADEVQDDDEMLGVHRMIYDYVRALEPSYQRRDAAEYLRRAKGKLAKLRKVAAFFADNYRRVSEHTNFQMAATSLKFVVEQIEEVLADVEPGANVGMVEDGHKPPLPSTLPEGVGQRGASEDEAAREEESDEPRAGV